MSAPPPARLAWALYSLGVVATVTGLVLLGLVPGVALERIGDSMLLSASFAAVLLVFGLVGATVASRMPRNPVGWIFLGLCLLNSAYQVAYGYAHYSLEVAALPGTTWSAWFVGWSTTLSAQAVALAFMVFPTGRLPSPRWRPIAWLVGLSALPVAAHYAVAPIGEFPAVANPFAPPGSEVLRALDPDLVTAPVLLVALAALLVRLRRSRGTERQQLKWFAWSAATIACFLPLALIGTKLSDGRGGAVEDAAGFVFALLLSLVPLSVGTAILRYRLYDIDLVINRTLVYGSLTAALVGAYLGIVLVLRLVLSPWTGQSDLAVAASTLTVAALFRPLRARIQQVVDRRFYRARYDAARTLESFSGRLRDELDLDALGSDLRRVVQDTVQPAHVSLWLREPT